MNMVLCGEACRWQKDGQCTLDDLSKTVNNRTSGDCRYFQAVPTAAQQDKRET